MTMEAENDVNGTNKTPQGGVPQSQPPAGAAVPQAAPNPMQNDIAKILHDLKLPERRGTPEQKPSQQFDTSLPSSSIQPRAGTGDSTQPSIASNDPAKPSVAEIAMGLHQKNSDVRALHTLKDDLQHVVKEKKISLVRAAALEEEKRHRVGASELAQAVVARPRRFGLAVFASVILISMGLLALGAVYLVMQQKQGGGSSPLESNSILFAEQTIPLAIDNQQPNDLRRELGALRTSTALTLGAILHIVPTINDTDVAANAIVQRLVTFSEFLEAIGASPPEDLVRALDSNFFIGIHTVDENAPVMVIPVVSYERAFPAMLQWEKTINADLTPIFTTVSRQTTGPDGIPRERNFEDAIMRNYDVRQLKDDAGVVQLFYSFPTRNILIIAESPYSFTEVLSRLRADRRL